MRPEGWLIVNDSSSVIPASSGVVKKNKAPLMAKALQLIKGRYKR